MNTYTLQLLIVMHLASKKKTFCKDKFVKTLEISED